MFGINVTSGGRQSYEKELMRKIFSRTRAIVKKNFTCFQEFECPSLRIIYSWTLWSTNNRIGDD